VNRRKWKSLHRWPGRKKAIASALKLRVTGNDIEKEIAKKFLSLSTTAGMKWMYSHLLDASLYVYKPEKGKHK
jgi:hypothetical protein